MLFQNYITVFIESLLEMGSGYILFALPFFYIFWVWAKKRFKSIPDRRHVFLLDAPGHAPPQIIPPDPPRTPPKHRPVAPDFLRVSLDGGCFRKFGRADFTVFHACQLWCTDRISGLRHVEQCIWTPRL